MESFKLHRIKELKHEVNDFHPLLSALFPKLPNITDVEYTQGTKEMGADFVLTKSDSTLDDVEYIGCIVKVGQIKQDHSEVNRQIEECEIERTINGGLRKIFLSEIWIISNGNITNGAQEKIHHKYKNKNIKFLPAEKVTALVDKYYPDYWTDFTVKVGEYLREIVLTANNLSKNNSLIDINNSDIYVPQQLIRLNTTKSVFNGSPKTVKRVTLDSALENEDFILIEAMMGAGKSTLLAKIAKNYADSQEFSEKQTLPILLTATELSNLYSGNIKEVVNKEISRGGLEFINKFIILIDGFDELKVDVSGRLEFIEQIFETARNLENVKVVITTRSIDEPELESEIDKYYARYKLCSLTIKQVISLVEKICKNVNVKQKLIKDLDKSHLFRVLPKTPISAILLAKLLKENVQEIPSTMTDLYNKYMELSLGRWDMDKGLQSQQEYDVIKNVTIELAKFIMDNSLIEISIGDAKAVFNKYTSSRNLKIDKDYIFEKLLNKEEILTFKKQKNTICFRHRTFAEYFYAQGLNRDNSAHIDEEIYDMYWATSYFFYIGLKRDCPELLKAINDIKFTKEHYRLLKIFNNGNFLLAAYLTPYDVIKSIVFDSFKNAAELYYKVTTEESDHPLRCLPQISMLCIFTQTLCDTFGYEFFSEALTEYSYELCTHPSLSDIQYIELFFTNSVRLSFDKNCPYDTMISNYGKNIPIQIQAGIIEHSESNNVHSGIVNRYSKKFKKNMKNNRGFLQAILDLYNEPVEKLQEKRITKGST